MQWEEFLCVMLNRVAFWNSNFCIQLGTKKKRLCKTFFFRLLFLKFDQNHKFKYETRIVLFKFDYIFLRHPTCYN